MILQYKEDGHRGGVIGVLVKNRRGMVYPVEPGPFWVFNWARYKEELSSIITT